MRKLTFFFALLLVAAIGWGAFWFIGASTVEKALGNWLAERRAEGWVAQAASLETRGFPNRFDTTFEGLDLADPDTRVAWSTPVFQLLSLSYKPTHLIAVWPAEQHVATPFGSYTLDAESMRGSIIVAPSLALETQSSTIEATGATITAAAGWTATLDHAQLSMRQQPDAPMAHTYDLYLTLSQLDPGETFLAPLKGVVEIPPMIEEITITGSARFDKAWDVSAIDVARPQPRSLTIDSLTAHWGTLVLAGRGSLDIDVNGNPAGEIAFEATNWRDMIAIAEATGALTEDQARAVTRALSMVAQLSGDPSRLELSLNFTRGVTFLGPIPIGAAPKIRLP